MLLFYIKLSPSIFLQLLPITAAAADQKKLYNLVDSWLGRAKERSLPDHQSASDLAASFSTFFHEKVDTTNEALASERSIIDRNSVLKSDPFLQAWSETDIFTRFAPVTMDDVFKVIMSSPA